MVYKTLFYTLILSLFISGCSSQQSLHVPKVPQTKSDYLPDSGYYFVLIEKEQQKWKIIQIEDKPTLKRANNNQELLLVAQSYNNVYPYFDETLKPQRDNEYLCDDSNVTTSYTPCSSALSLNSKSRNLSDYFNNMKKDSKKYRYVSKSLINQAISDTNLYKAIENKKNIFKYAQCEENFYKANSVEDFNEFVKNYADYEEAKNLLILALQNLQNLKDEDEKNHQKAQLSQKNYQDSYLKSEQQQERENLFLTKKEQSSIDDYAKKLTNFRKTLKIGTETNCGTIVEMDSKKANISLNDKKNSVWIEKNKIFPKGDGCRFVKGRYIVPPSF
ncbi:hypothetical protein Suden_1645 [Sulfurimonas denitrificans DSM 1251]|uniref:Lipoprotein n=1 Tax=Sulfurimonas denitrificans (strain ATCC 33889 / DSM 1251) TaxID=326298 RepID=Q30Q09_SULDN|nr:hypothetical protein [Sulfurimonas denitrificans]ABB44922.1 hypothetical protein Suden_1645 [Sulfurimonas denitrificans DSM 1251]